MVESEEEAMDSAHEALTTGQAQEAVIQLVLGVCPVENGEGEKDFQTRAVIEGVDEEAEEGIDLITTGPRSQST